MTSEDRIEKLENEVNFLLDVINLLHINDLLPPKLLERSKNRVKINELEKDLKENPNDILEKKLKKCRIEELKQQKKFKKFNKNNFIFSFLRRIRER